MITKRQAGWVLIIGGLGGNGLLLLLDVLGLGKWGGIGPLERALLLGGLLIAVLGWPLLRRDGPLAASSEPRLASSPFTVSPMVRWASYILLAVAILWFVGYLGVYITYADSLFHWPYDYDQGESFELHDAILHSEGRWPYQDSGVFPFYSSNYPPVFHLMMIPLFPLFGKTLLAGRVLSFTMTLLTAALLGLTVRRRTGGVILPLLAALAYPASNFVYHVGPLCRQQLTMVFWETLAVYFIAGAQDETHGQRDTALGLLSLLLAGYTKQLSVFTAAAIFTYLFLVQPRRAMKLVLGFGLVFGAIFWGINQATHGQWWLNTISANVNAYMMPQLVGLTRSWFKIHPLFILTAFAWVGYELYFARLSLYSLWFLFALGTGLMSGKWGAGEAYWITSVAAAIVLTGFAWGKLRQWSASRPRYAALITVLLPVFFIFQASRMVHLPTAGPVWGPVARMLGVADRSAYADYPYYDAVGYSQVGHLMLPRDYTGGETIMRYVRATDGPIFSEEAAFPMLAGKPVVTNPTQLLNLYNNGLWDPAPLTAMIRQQAFGLVIMRAQFYPPPVLQALGQSYGLVEHVQMNGFQYIIMKPLTESGF